MRPNSNQSQSGTSPSPHKPSVHLNGAGKRSSRHSSHQRNFRDYVLMIRERWLIGFATAAILVGLLAFHQLRQPPLFEASASLMFEENKPQVVDIEEVVDTSIQSATVDPILETHVGQLKSASCFNYVADTFTQEEETRLNESYLLPENEAPEPQLHD